VFSLEEVSAYRPDVSFNGRHSEVLQELGSLCSAVLADSPKVPTFTLPNHQIANTEPQILAVVLTPQKYFTQALALGESDLPPRRSGERRTFLGGHAKA